MKYIFFIPSTRIIRTSVTMPFSSYSQVNTCPIDRNVFKCIIVYNRIGGHEVAREVCKQKQQVIENEVVNFDDTVLCERCGCGDRSEVLLLCDGKLNTLV